MTSMWVYVISAWVLVLGGLGLLRRHGRAPGPAPQPSGAPGGPSVELTPRTGPEAAESAAPGETAGPGLAPRRRGCGRRVSVGCP